MKILITGASRGIGAFLMKELIKKDYDVFGTYHSSSVTEFKEKLTKVDIKDENQVRDWINSKVTSKDDVVLINCAGSNYNSFAHKAQADEWRSVVETNLFGTFYAIQNVLPIMREKGFGRIINFASIVAQKGIPGTSAYAASKSALWGLSKSIAVENATKGITINNLNLGYFDIGMITDVPDPILDQIKNSIPSKSLGDPENILRSVEYLINNEYINGSSLDINGGLF